ncbi:MAG TPA: hypothetical protein VIY51_13675 [Xanthobacteraceae bacterium]
MRVRGLALILILSAALGACVPDVVGIEAVPPPKLARDLRQCEAQSHSYGFWIDNEVKRCMKAKGHVFLREY